MSDSVELPSGELVPIQGTVCDCAHWYQEHEIGGACCAVGCGCRGFVADPLLSMRRGRHSAISGRAWFFGLAFSALLWGLIAAVVLPLVLR